MNGKAPYKEGNAIYIMLQKTSPWKSTLYFSYNTDQEWLLTVAYSLANATTCQTKVLNESNKTINSPMTYDYRCESVFWHECVRMCLFGWVGGLDD